MNQSSATVSSLLHPATELPLADLVEGHKRRAAACQDPAVWNSELFKFSRCPLAQFCPLSLHKGSPIYLCSSQSEGIRWRLWRRGTKSWGVLLSLAEWHQTHILLLFTPKTEQHTLVLRSINRFIPVPAGFRTICENIAAEELQEMKSLIIKWFHFYLTDQCHYLIKISPKIHINDN